MWTAFDDMDIYDDKKYKHKLHDQKTLVTSGLEFPVDFVREGLGVWFADAVEVMMERFHSGVFY